MMEGDGVEPNEFILASVSNTYTACLNFIHLVYIIYCIYM